MSRGLDWRTDHTDAFVIILFNKRCSSPLNSSLWAKTIPAVSALSAGQGQCHLFCTMMNAHPRPQALCVSLLIELKASRGRRISYETAPCCECNAYTFHYRAHACLFNSTVKQEVNSDFARYTHTKEEKNWFFFFFASDVWNCSNQTLKFLLVTWERQRSRLDRNSWFDFPRSNRQYRFVHVLMNGFFPGWPTLPAFADMKFTNSAFFFLHS